MPVVVFEKWKSRAGKASVEDPSIAIVYGVKGTLDELDVDAAIAATSPATWNDLTRQNWTRECLGPTDDGGLWEVTVNYDRNALKGAGTSQMTIDTTGGHQHVTQSKETVARYGVEETNHLDPLPITEPPHLHGAIGVTDTSIDGVDVMIPKMELTITAIVKATSLASDFLHDLHAATSMVNDELFSLNYYGQKLNAERKARAEPDFRFFCEAYFPLTFHLPWSQDHLKVIGKIEQAVLRGGLFAMAMPRGSGKTTICECACIWAVLYGHRDFVCLIGSDEGHAMDMLESIKTELDGNDLLLEDFPEVVFPIQKLDGIANRCAGQLYKGERTHIGWTAKEVVLPSIAGSKASGAIIKVAGITGRIRGMKFKRSDGHTVRPTLVVLDDPQTDESARSLSQCATRESILAGAVLGLAGPGKKISGIMPCTVIRPGDMADNILDRDKHPEWNGERTKMVYAFPSNEKLWQHYAEVRAESLRAGNAGDEATEFYRVNREAMDDGAVIAWPERYNPDELSAVQHAMNLKLQDEAAFFAEYQNEPLPAEAAGDDELTVDQIAGKVNRFARAEVPIGCNHVTMFVDVQATLLFYVVAAWEDSFTGYVIDYGTYPDQKRPYFTLRDARHTLAVVSPAAGLEGSIYAGLDTLTMQSIGREWHRDDGAALRIERCLIDANWGSSTDVIYQFCRQSAHAGVVMPSHGRFVGAGSQPFSEYKRRPGDRVGHNWRIPNVHGKRAVRHVVFDTNFWKSFVHARLAVALGDKGCLSLFGDRPEQHRLLAEHLSAEYRVKTEGRGRTVDEWKVRPEQTDNHWLDCLVGCAVAASIQGATLMGTGVPAPAKKQRVSFAELQKKRRA